MAADKKYTPERRREAEKTARSIAKIPEEKQEYAMVIISTFISGMEAQRGIDRLCREGMRA